MGKKIKRNYKKAKTSKLSRHRHNNMLAASLVGLCFIAVGLYGYLTKSFEKGGVYVVLTDTQALGALVFCCLVAVGILIYAWNLKQKKGRK